MLLSIQELEEAAVMHPDIVEYVKQRQSPSMVDPSDFLAFRRGMDTIDAAYNEWTGPPFTGFELFHEIPMRDGFMSSLKIQKPAAGELGPLIVLVFGGGFVAGSNQQFIKTGRVLVNQFGATVVSISYRLAPEYKFPIGQYDAWDSMKWIAENAAGNILCADPNKGFLLGGVSAGGAVTASLSRVFQDEPLAHPLTGQWLAIPSLMEEHHVPEKYKDYFLSPAQQAKNPVFSRESREKLMKLVQADVNSPLRYAIVATNDLSAQPRTYFQIDGADPLRDHGLIYDEMLKEAGVETKVDFYPGCPHGHFCGFKGLDITNQANIDTIVGFGWLLGMEVSRKDAAKQLDL